MPFARRKLLTLGFLLAVTLVAGSAGAAEATPPRLSGLHARIGQGGTVDLAASTLTAAELAAMRPGYQSLKPRVRTNAE